MISHQLMYRLDITNPSKGEWKAYGFRVDLSSVDLHFWYNTPSSSISRLLECLIKRDRRDVLLKKDLYYTEKWRKNWKYV